MKKYIVYLTINNINRKIYVGVHKTTDNTFDGYIGCGITNYTKTFKEYPLHRAVKKYGYNNFSRVTLGDFDTAEEAYIQEAAIVDKEFIIRRDTYNVKVGGVGGNGKHTKIIQYSLDGKFIKLWESIKETYTHFNKKSGSSLIKCLSGRHSTYLGYQWRYFEEDFPKVISTTSVLSIPLHQYCDKGLLIKTWKNKLKASKSLDCSSSALRHATQSKKLYCGFQWRYFLGGAPDSIPEFINKDLVLQIDKNTNSIVKEWPKLVDALTDGFNVSKNMIPRYGKAKEFSWAYKYIYTRS